MAEGYNYHLSIPWHVARSYFKMLKERANDESMNLSDKELHWSQGRAQAYKMLDNLPEQLDVVAGEEKETKDG